MTLLGSVIVLYGLVALFVVAVVLTGRYLYWRQWDRERRQARFENRSFAWRIRELPNGETEYDFR